MLSRFFPQGWRQAAAKTPQQSKRPAEHSPQFEPHLAADDAPTRRAALTRTDDLSVLQRLMCEDGDAGVRDCAQARLCKLIEGSAEPVLPLAERQAALQAIMTPLLAERFAVKATEPALRILALQRVEREEFCADRAVADPVAKVREAALEQVFDPEHLTRIARRTRKSDKHISRSAKRRAQALDAERQRLQAIEAMCVELDTLPWDGETGPNTARFAQIEQRWQSLAAEVSAEQQQRFQAAQERFQARLRASAAQRQQRVQLCRQADTLLQYLYTVDQPDAEPPVPARHELMAQWQSMEPADDPESLRLQRHFDEQCAAIAAREQTLKEQRRKLEQLRKVCAQGEQLLQHPGRLAGATVKRFVQDGQVVLNSGVELGDLPAQFKQIDTALQRRLAEQDTAQSAEQADLKTTLEALEHALDAGELQQAIHWQNRVQQQLADNIGLTQRQMRDFRQRLQSLGPRIAQLRDWRRWGTNRSRESLIEAVEQLVDSGLPPEELVTQVQQARQHWKTMDKTGVRAPQALWRQFDRACERAYQPVRVWRAEQAAQRQKNWEARVRLCEQLEQHVQMLDTAPSGDWRAVSRFEQRVRQQWQQAGPVDRRQHKVIERRYLAAIKRLQDALQPVLEQELARRCGLIDQAEALADSADHARAVETAKRLQSEWQPQVLASRRQEQILWKRFRAACDAVFERRQAEQALQRDKQKNLQRQKDEVLAAIADLTERLGDSTLSDADERFASLRKEWNVKALSTADRDGERRFAQACQRFQARRDTLACREELEAVLQLRPSTVAVASPQDLAAHQQRCLQLEILLGLETPSEFAQARMQFRVAQLSEALGEREQVDTGHWSEVLALVREGCRSPAVDDPQSAARWQCILAALQARVEIH